MEHWSTGVLEVLECWACAKQIGYAYWLRWPTER